MNITTRNNKMKEIFDSCLKLSKAKGKDYAGAEDSLANLRIFGFKGIIIRLFDKLMRLKNIEEAGKVEVKDESVRDTLMDTIIYSALAIILLEDEDQTSVTTHYGYPNDCEIKVVTDGDPDDKDPTISDPH